MDKKERRHRLEQLIANRNEKILQRQFENKLQQLSAIYKNYKVTIMDMTSSEQIEQQMTSIFPIASWGRIDWKQVEDKIELAKTDREKLPAVLCERTINLKENVYVIAGIVGYPVVETTFEQVLLVIEQIYELGPDQWIFSKDQQKVIEFTHDDEILLGFKKRD